MNLRKSAVSCKNLRVGFSLSLVYSVPLSAPRYTTKMLLLSPVWLSRDEISENSSGLELFPAQTKDPARTSIFSGTWLDGI